MTSDLMLILSHFYGASAKERHFVMNVIQLRKGLDPLVSFEFSLDPLSQHAQSILQMWEDLAKEDWDFLYQLYTEEVNQGGTKPFESDNHLSWLKLPVLKNTDVILGCCLELHEQGHDTLRVQMISEMLEGIDREVSNTTTFVRYLTAKLPALIEIVTENAGRHGVTFKLTTAGFSEAKKLREKHSSKPAGRDF